MICLWKILGFHGFHGGLKLPEGNTPLGLWFGKLWHRPHSWNIGLRSQQPAALSLSLSLSRVIYHSYGSQAHLVRWFVPLRPSSSFISTLFEDTESHGHQQSPHVGSICLETHRRAPSLPPWSHEAKKPRAQMPPWPASPDCRGQAACLRRENGMFGMFPLQVWGGNFQQTKGPSHLWRTMYLLSTAKTWEVGWKHKFHSICTCSGESKAQKTQNKLLVSSGNIDNQT